MKKFFKISAIVLIILLVIGFAAKKILLDYSFIPEKSNISLNVNDLRELASRPGPLPVRVNLLRIGLGEFLPGMVVAGRYDTKYGAALVSYQVVYDSALPGGGNTVIIDAGLHKSQIKMMKGNVSFDDARYDSLQKGMKNAAAIVFTHEHFDHIGGMALSPFFPEIAGKTLLTAEQMASPLILQAGFSREMLTKCKKITYEGSYVPAPGIVLVKTSGHTPGHQMIYVKLKNGGEYLIAGDIAWNMDNLTQLQRRPILVSLFLGENRDHVGNQLRWLHDEIYQAHKEIRLLVYHDQARQDEYVKQGLLGDGFEL